eukprot:6008779-Prymnesium_polylepis.1
MTPPVRCGLSECPPDKPSTIGPAWPHHRPCTSTVCGDLQPRRRARLRVHLRPRMRVLRTRRARPHSEGRGGDDELSLRACRAC